LQILERLQCGAVKTVPLPLLYVLLAAVIIAIPAFGPAAAASPAAILLAPILYRTGERLRAALSRGAFFQALPASLGLVILGTLILGGAAYAIGPVGLGAGLPEALLLGAVLSTAEPWGTSRPASSPRSLTRGAARLQDFLDAQCGISVLLAIPVFAVLGSLAAHPAPPLWSPGLDLLKGFACGTAAGIAAMALLRPLRTPVPRSAVHFAAGIVAALAAAAVAGSAPLAALVAGAVARRDARTGIEGARTGRRVAGPEREAEEAGAPAEDLLVLIAAAGILVLAARMVTAGSILPILPFAILLWVGSTAIRLLVQFGFTGLRRWRRPGELPARWLPAVAWGSFPGATGLGLLLAASGPGILPGDAILAAGMAVILGAAIQGGSTGAALRRALAWPGRTLESDRWESLAVQTVALRAQRRTVEVLRTRGDIDEEAAEAMADALGNAERKIDLAREEFVRQAPEMRGAELARAVRIVIESGREAVAAARARGEIDAASAEEVERELAIRWLRSDSSTVDEVLGSVPGKSFIPRAPVNAAEKEPVPGGATPQAGDTGPSAPRREL
jgi:hypothetical protein